MAPLDATSSSAAPAASLRGKKILVTGADGFIGSHLTEHLVRSGADVRAFVYYNSFNSWGWLDESPDDVKRSLDVFSGDIRDPYGVRAAMQGCRRRPALGGVDRRAEHWIVVSGTAEVTNGETVTMLSENQSTYVPPGQKHSLAGPGKAALEIVEVQSGSYLGENGMVRFEDNDGRG